MGYHVREIPRGEFGEISKIQEEWEEFIDSIGQGNHLMALMELSDLFGAIEAWLSQYHPSITIRDLLKMTDATRRAFLDGTRKAH